MSKTLHCSRFSCFDIWQEIQFSCHYHSRTLFEELCLIIHWKVQFWDTILNCLSKYKFRQRLILAFDLITDWDRKQLYIICFSIFRVVCTLCEVQMQLTCAQRKYLKNRLCLLILNIELLKKYHIVQYSRQFFSRTPITNGFVWA